MSSEAPGRRGQGPPPQRSVECANISGAAGAGQWLVCSSLTCSPLLSSSADTTNSSSFMKVELPSLLDIARKDDILLIENFMMFPPTAGRNGGYPPSGQDLPSPFQGTVIHWMLSIYWHMTWPQVEVLISLSMKLQKRRRKQYRAEVWMFSPTGMFSRLRVSPFLNLLECCFSY